MERTYAQSGAIRLKGRGGFQEIAWMIAGLRLDMDGLSARVVSEQP